MTYRSRLIVFVIALSLFGGTAKGEVRKIIEKNYTFDQVNGKVLPIPSELPETCQASVGGWPFVGYAFGGVYLPAVPYPISAVVSITGTDTIGMYSGGRYCTFDGAQYVVNYCISTPTQSCSRPKFRFKTKSAVIGVRG